MISVQIIIISSVLLLRDIENIVNGFSKKVTLLTKDFVNTKYGQWFLFLPIFGPLLFIPIQVGIWKADYIAPYEMFSWSVMILINLSSLVSVCHKGDWRVSLSMIGWVLTMVSITLASCLK